jgi:hypothetical protein
MRFLIYLAVFVGFLSFAEQNEVLAQTYYNAPYSTNSGTLYNTPTANSGPLNLKAYARGNTSSAKSSTGYTYKGKPYGVDRSDYSLALSPQQVQENRKRRALDEAKRAREKEDSRRKYAESSDESVEKQNYLNKFQNSTGQRKSTVKKRVLYTRDSALFNAPKRVFNSPY